MRSGLVTFGHLLRHPDKEAPQLVIRMSTAGRPRRGCPTRTNVNRLVEATGLQSFEIARLAENHQLWSA